MRSSRILLSLLLAVTALLALAAPASAERARVHARREPLVIPIRWHPPANRPERIRLRIYWASQSQDRGRAAIDDVRRHDRLDRGGRGGSVGRDPGDLRDRDRDRGERGGHGGRGGRSIPIFDRR